jgi:predicted nucleotidyltransferase
MSDLWASQPVTRGRIESAARELAAESEYRLIILFGSAARGDDRIEVLDIGILADHDIDTVAVTNRLTAGLGIQNVDVTDLRHADPLLLILVARDGVPLYDATGNEFANFWSLAARRFADTRKFRELEHEAIHEFLARHRKA